MAARAQAAIDLCERYGFVYYGEWGQIFLAWHDRDVPGSNSVTRIEAAWRASDRSGRSCAARMYLSILAQTHRRPAMSIARSRSLARPSPRRSPTRTSTGCPRSTD